ncbi:MAG: helix-turn-helix domain-containing protein [Ignavibacteria bacterium]|nr:helix-turn-helix domain-containing protein [Ignavibacteria bacterium]
MEKIESGMSDKMVLATLGRRIRQERINQNITQNDLAARAGVGRIVVQRLEGGKGCALGAFTKVLRALGRLTQIDLFLPEPGISPLLLARSKKGERMRARRRTASPLNQRE